MAKGGLNQMSKYIVCPRCKGKETSDKEFEVDSSINGHNIEIKCPYCDKYSFFVLNQRDYGYVKKED